MLCETIHLQKKIKNNYIIKDVSMSIPENSIYTLAGPNGSGKSTLLKLLTKMQKPTSGEILFKGNTLSSRDLIHIGSLIETPALYENLTAEENLLVKTIFLGIDNKAIDIILDLVELSDAKKQIVKYYSLGMKQKLGIAIALLNNPQFLILDEPTNGLDPLSIRHLKRIMKNFQNNGGTILIATHILKEMNDIASHIGIIQNGSLICQKEIRTGKDDIESIFMNTLMNKM